jgi:hypothetical protein
MAEKVDDTEKSEQNFSLLDDDNVIRVIVNGSEKYLAKDWLGGDGRATGSVGARSILQRNGWGATVVLLEACLQS